MRCSGCATRPTARGGDRNPIASEKFSDSLDSSANVWIFGVFLDGKLASSIRLHIASPDCGELPALNVFSDILGPQLASGRTIIDPTRFVADRELSRRYPELCYVTTRLAWLASEYFQTDLLLATVRAEHQAFYRRTFGHQPICPPRHYPSLTKPISLMALGLCRRAGHRAPALPVLPLDLFRAAHAVCARGGAGAADGGLTSVGGAGHPSLKLSTGTAVRARAVAVRRQHGCHRPPGRRLWRRRTEHAWTNRSCGGIVACARHDAGRSCVRSPMRPADANRRETSLHYAGWRVVLLCFVMAVLCWGLGFYGHGFYLAELKRQHGWPTALISSASTTCYLFSFPSHPIKQAFRFVPNPNERQRTSLLLHLLPCWLSSISECFFRVVSTTTSTPRARSATTAR